MVMEEICRRNAKYGMSVNFIPAFFSHQLTVYVGDIDSTKTQTIKVSKQTGSWWSTRKKEESAPDANKPVAKSESVRRPSRSFSLLSLGSSSRDEDERPLPALPTTSNSDKKAKEETASNRRMPIRSSTDFWPMRKREEPEEISAEQRPSHVKSSSEGDLSDSELSELFRLL